MSLETISEAALEQMDTIMTHLAGLRECAEKLRILRSQGTDAIASTGQESAKRDMLGLYSEMAASIEAGCDFVDRGAMDADAFKDELLDMLTAPAALENTTPSPGMGPGWYTIGQVRQIMGERARNIAQAYTGRIIKESK